MLAKLKTFSLLGIDALPVEVEVDVSPSGLPKTVLVGSYCQNISQGRKQNTPCEILSLEEYSFVAIVLAGACCLL